MRDHIAELTAADVVPIGVNPGSAESHQAFIDAFDLPFDLLVDDGRAVTAAYGALKPEGNGIARTVVLVGKDGRVVARQQGAPPPEEMAAAAVAAR